MNGGKRTSQNVRGWVTGAVIVGAFAGLVWAEQRRPLRAETESKMRRDLRNLAVAALSAATLQVLQKPLLQPLAAAAEQRRWGLVRQLDLPRWLEIPLSVVLLDYSLYVWHFLTHRVPVLWRFHQVHHVDLDLSASTALRFHFGEMALQVPWRLAQVVVIGPSRRALTVWQALLFLSIVFHHSNLRLPHAVERQMVRFVVTPRMHGIHHSIVPEETSSNWSSGLTIWDRLHGTLRLGIPQDEITIGVPAYRQRWQVTLGRLLALPFTRQRPSFLLPDGERPRRQSLHRAGAKASENAL